MQGASASLMDLGEPLSPYQLLLLQKEEGNRHNSLLLMQTGIGSDAVACPRTKEGCV